MDEVLELGTEYRYHLMDDLSGKVGGAFIQDPRRLCLTSKGIMNRELESVALNFKRHLRQHLNNLPIHKLFWAIVRNPELDPHPSYL